MNRKKNILNILLGLVPSSKLRKKLRFKIENKINNNKLIIINKDISFTNCIKDGIEINFTGQNSIVIIHEPINFQGCSVKAGNNSKVEIFSSKFNISDLHISATKTSEVIIGENFSCYGCSIENQDEPNLKVMIGKDCLFSNGINIRVSDGHSIYQLNNSEIINKPKSGVTIGDHVWIGMNCTILKDVSIPSNSVVGACSLVTKTINQENVVIAGTPAKIIRENINWLRKNTDDPE